MRDTDLFQLALGLVPPWMVKTCAFDAAARRLDIEIDFARVAVSDARSALVPTAPCTTRRCSSGGISTSSSIRRSCTRAHRASGARLRCRTDRGAGAGSGFTLQFEALAMTLMTAAPFRDRF